MGGILRYNLGEGNRVSKIAARQWGVNFCREASRCLARPSGCVLAPAQKIAEKWSLALRSWRPSKEVPKPRPGKVPKSASESAGPKQGAEGSAEKSAPGSRLLL